MKQSLFIFILILAYTVLISPVFSGENKSKAENNSDSTKQALPDSISLSPDKYIRPTASTKFYKSKNKIFGLWINDNKWIKANIGLSEESDMEFEHIDGDAYVMVMFEKNESTIENLKNIALENARGVARDAKTIFEEPRIVNDHEIVCMQINGTIDFVPFTYLGYYFAGKRGTIQVIAFTKQNLFGEYKQDFEDFLNGLDILK